MPRKLLVYNVWLTQGLLLLLSVAASFFVFDSFSSFLSIWNFSYEELFKLALPAAAMLIAANIIYSKIVPEKWLDDDGVNEKLFGESTIGEIMIISLAVAICEEFFFRGILQTQFGLLVASVIFAVIHFRYLKNFFLFAFILFTSVMFGLLFELTNSITITIIVHFLIDCILGFVLLFEKKKEKQLL